MSDVDEMDVRAIESFLDKAQLHATAGNDWAEGFWLGHAVQHANQNALDYDWLVSEFESRGLDAAVIAVSKPGDPVEPRLN